MPNDDDKLLLKAIRREAVPRRPLWIMRQAGRYLPEYREFRAEAQLQGARRRSRARGRSDADAAEALSARRRDRVRGHHEPDAGARHRVRLRSRAPSSRIRSATRAAIERLRRPRPRGDRARGHPGAEADARGAAEEHGAARLLRRAVDARGLSRRGQGHEGFSDAARVRGRASRRCSTRCSRGSRASWASTCSQQAAAGADAVQIFDSWAGLLSRASWERLIRPHLHSLLEAVGKAGVPRILFLQNAPHLMDAYASLPAEVLGVDWRIDLPDLARRYPQRAVQGNLEPAILTAGAEATRAAARELLARRRRAATS